MIPFGSALRRRRSLLLAAIGAIAAACTETPPPIRPEDMKDLLDRVASRKLGFTVGRPDTSSTGHVFFDPLCGHCHELWRASQPLWSSMAFSWVPVGRSDLSLARGVALLVSERPAVSVVNLSVAKPTITKEYRPILLVQRPTLQTAPFQQTPSRTPGRQDVGQPRTSTDATAGQEPR